MITVNDIKAQALTGMLIHTAQQRVRGARVDVRGLVVMCVYDPGACGGPYLWYMGGGADPVPVDEQSVVRALERQQRGLVTGGWVTGTPPRIS